MLARVLPVTVAVLRVANLVFLLLTSRIEALTGFGLYAFEQLGLAGEVNVATWSSSMLLLCNAVLADVPARRWSPLEQ